VTGPRRLTNSPLEAFEDAFCDHGIPAGVGCSECEHDWRRIALHALSDLRMLGVPIDRIISVDDDVVRQVDEYDRDQAAFS
jgi:hypothetical protein